MSEKLDKMQPWVNVLAAFASTIVGAFCRRLADGGSDYLGLLLIFSLSRRPVTPPLRLAT